MRISPNHAQRRTIQDFSDQWKHYSDIDNGYYGSDELFTDIFPPLLSKDAVTGRAVLEIGSGTGRITKMLLLGGATKVIAVEPSRAFDLLRTNTADFGDRIELLQCPGDEIEIDAGIDFAVSIGVVHHIPDPAPTMRAIFKALRPGGQCFIWIYGAEGNGFYLSVITPIRFITTRLPHNLLVVLSSLFQPLVKAYQILCTWIPLPMSKYFTEVIGKLTSHQVRAVIYDQLNPTFAKYYTRSEALELLKAAGFIDIQLHHRHGYSWSVLARKPLA